MQAVIPIAGFGKRLKPHTHSLPKVLLNVGGKPIIGHILDKLLEEKIYDTTFIIGYMGEMIVDYVKDNYPDINASYVEQKELLGLGHAIYTAIPTFNNDELFIVLGDTIFDVDLKHVLNAEYSSLGVKEIDDPKRFGVAVLENDKVVKLVEKPQTPVSKLALVGLYYVKNSKLLAKCLNEIIEKEIKTKNEYQLTDALQLMIEKGEVVTTFPVHGWYDCGKPETLLATNKYLLSVESTNRKIESVVINPPVYIAESALLKNCVVGPYTTIAENCKIENAVIRNSIINANAVVENIVMEDSLIGGHAILKGDMKNVNIGDSSEINYSHKLEV